MHFYAIFKNVFGIFYGLCLDAKVEPHFERLDSAYKSACELIPSLKGADVSARASAFTMTADGYPLVGPTSHRQNYWLLVGNKVFFLK